MRVTNSRDLVDVLLESFKLSTTQINLPSEQGDFLLRWGQMNIPEEILFVDEAENGREAEPHISVLYGLLSSTPTPELRDAIASVPMFKVGFGTVSIFENDKYDVIKLAIESPMLRVLHAKIKATCENDYKWPTYEPHATLAYVQPGQGGRFIGKQVFTGEGAPKPFFWAKEILFSGKGDRPQRETLSLRREKDVAESDPFAGIAFADVQTWMRGRGIRPKRVFTNG